MQDDIEPLPPDLWFERIEMIATGQLGSTENALRHALHLLQLTPHQFLPREYGNIDEESYEALLEAGDLDAAARRLIAAPALTVSATSSAEGVEVAIGCRILNQTIVGRGDSVAAAILHGWTECLFALRSEFGSSGSIEATGH